MKPGNPLFIAPLLVRIVIELFRFWLETRDDD
ncbi:MULTISPECIES: type I toxin-antitoxin system Fst family toxin [Aerococcus]|uniref:Type I toxin-antitoxin system Fst family toxin n=1 Tax=Aerococcus urinae TaxID=1376 RepID=A0A329NXJ0_9LACT|nr:MULTISPECIES: type I toxin-antitoxin system Fst family toxin [Aerococcus]KAA9219249.1 type I toxin-antitoxin system Fst family toxin [Aerococcus loyolae]KAA9266618.1 type I toxin-antitoxin system Fst family toxin [Aerococcus loyolae]MCY3067730.1 type I toxin-antitoxin system Fst family toxin [Aerococcus mictus]MCY3080369.1 type I toxin-antitoxin system Fst family toxin [Aerococcus mictus]MDK6231447.1 type I toxin-antitoxin system Fst family toxin [Aerococcus urinae]